MTTRPDGRHPSIRRVRCLVAVLVLGVAACSSSETSTPAVTGEPDPAEASTDAGASGATIDTTIAPAGTAPASGVTSTAPADAPAPSTADDGAPETTDGPPATATTAAESTPTTAPAPTTEPDLTAAEMADMEAARTVLITLDDFPDGWTEEPDDDEDDPDTAAFEADFDECLGRDDDRVGDELEHLVVATGDFHPVDESSPSVSHEVVLAPDEARALEAMADVVVDGAETCLGDVIRRFYVESFADDPDLADIAIGEVRVGRTEVEQPADLTVGVLLEVPLTLDDQVVTQFLEILYQRRGRALSELSFSSFGEPFSRDGYAVLADEVAIGLEAVG